MENAVDVLEDIFNQMLSEYKFEEYVHIKTCNRNEFYIHSDHDPVKYPLPEINNEVLTLETNHEAIEHLLRMASGLESLVIGEDQILGQLKDALKTSQKEKHIDKVLELLFTKAIHVGQAVRQKTEINRGSVSIGSIAINLAEKEIGTLDGKKVLVVGAGKMGALVATSLCEKNLKAVLVANRTHDRAVKLANELGGTAIYFDELNDNLETVDVLISATGAPHTLISCERVQEYIPSDRYSSVIMIDLANPRDIDENVSDLGVKLLNIDDLRGIAAENAAARANEAVEAEKIIDEESVLLSKAYKHMEIENTISSIRKNMEDIRGRETRKALSKMGDLHGKEKVLDKMSRSIVDKIFYDIAKNLKKATEEDNQEVIDACKYLFQINE